jgi:anti-anti-sigma factor
VDHPLAEVLALTVEVDGHTCCLRLEGDFDLSSVQRVERVLEDIDDRVECLVIDLELVHFLDLGALRTILRAHETGRKKGFDVKVIKPRGPAGRLFTLTPMGRELMLIDAVPPREP